MNSSTTTNSLAILLAGIFVIALFLVLPVPARTATQDDAAALFKAKCAMCHGATAEKKFDAAKPDAELIDTVMKGRKMEKPPNMPSYEEKGLTADQAKALVAFMKSQKQ